MPSPKVTYLEDCVLEAQRVEKEDLPNTCSRCRRKRDGNRFAKKKRLKSGGQRHPPYIDESGRVCFDFHALRYTFFNTWFQTSFEFLQELLRSVMRIATED